MIPTNTLKLGTVAGIRIGVDLSWFFVLFLFIFLLSDSFQAALGGSETEGYLVAVASALLFFASLVLHELGHALAARREGIGTSGIDLFMFGGVAKLTRDSRTPGEEFRVAAAGPAVTLLITVVLAAGGALLAGGGRFLESTPLDTSGTAMSPLLLVTGWLATINAALLVFNLVPAFPLDGGRLLRALVWRVTGRRGRSTRFAARIGQLFGWFLVALGAFQLLSGGGSTLDGLWWIILGFFLTQGARREVIASRFTERLEGMTVADVMEREPVQLPAEVPVAEAVDAWFARYGWSRFPVTAHDGTFLGFAHRAAVEDALRGGLGTEPVGRMLDADAELSVPWDRPLEELLASEPLRRHGALIALDHHGRLQGIVTLDAVQRALAAATPARRPAA